MNSLTPKESCTIIGIQFGVGIAYKQKPVIPACPAFANKNTGFWLIFSLKYMSSNDLNIIKISWLKIWQTYEDSVISV
jgi:hypothetical protein